MILKEKGTAPDFELPDQNGKIHKLSDYKGKWVLLYFYPKDDTPGCTKEACGIRDTFPDFRKLNITVLGISTDSVKSHKKFEEKYKLPFTLLADEQKEVVNLYESYGEKNFTRSASSGQVLKKYMGIFRNSFLINPEGKIAKIYEKVKPEIHAEEVLKDITAFR